jgi:hypothetical protein
MSKEAVILRTSGFVRRKFMKLKVIIGSVCMLATLGCSGKQSDFDLVCGYFTELESWSKQKVMAGDEKRLFIHAKVVENLPSNSNARIAWETLVVAEPSVIYPLFVQAAESAGEVKWQCPVMEKLTNSF